MTVYTFHVKRSGLEDSQKPAAFPKAGPDEGNNQLHNASKEVEDRAGEVRKGRELGKKIQDRGKRFCRLQAVDVTLTPAEPTRTSSQDPAQC